jgi:uncharacterized protein (TIGR02270 family)
MATSAREFAVNLYEEHLEDASFLYRQTAALRKAADLPWPRLADFEERLEANLDALVIGGALALEVCQRRAQEGDAGELFAAVSVFCRNEAAPLLAETWRTLDYQNPARTQAVVDALKYDLPQSWQPSIQRAIERGDPRQLPLVARVCAFRGEPFAKLLKQRASADGGAGADVVTAVGRLPDRAHADSVLFEGCRHEDSTVKCAAYWGLLRMGHRDALHQCVLLAAHQDWPQVLVGLAGDRAAVGVLRQRVDAGHATPDTLLALGLLGDVTAARCLTKALVSDELAPAAAEALHWITGAPLFEETFEPEEVEEIALFDHELSAWRERGELPRRADGQPFGTTVKELITDAEVWNDWLDTHATQFDPQYRYRRGQPYSARTVLACLLDETVSNRMRQLAYEELCIRFGNDVPFDTDLPVRQQTRALRAIADRLTSRESQLPTGQW